VRFLIDMGLATGVARWLRGRGHDAVHLPAEGLRPSPDPGIADAASGGGPPQSTARR